MMRRPSLARLLNHLLALLANVLHVGVIGGVSRVAGMTDFAGGNLREMLLENPRQLLRKHLAVVDADVVMDKVNLTDGRHVRGDDLRIICDDRAIVVIVAQCSSML